MVAKKKTRLGVSNPEEVLRPLWHHKDRRGTGLHVLAHKGWNFLNFRGVHRQAGDTLLLKTQAKVILRNMGPLNSLLMTVMQSLII